MNWIKHCRIWYPLAANSNKGVVTPKLIIEVWTYK
jgi:hypothetical protein